MKEDFVSYGLAIKLKEKGYPQNGDHYFNGRGCIEVPVYNFLEDDMSDTVAPQIHEVLKWLREEKHIAINITFIPICWQFTVLPMSFNKDRFKLSGKTFYFSYEQASLAGIEYAIDNLI